MTEQFPPTAIADEEAVLAEVLDHPVALKGVQKIGLKPEAFYLLRHQTIFRAQRRAAAEGKHPDEPTTWATLQTMGLALPDDAPIDAEGVKRHQLGQLVGRSTSPFRVYQPAERIIEAANLRAKLEGARMVQDGVFVEEEAKRAELFQDGLELIVSNFATNAEPTSAKEIADEFRHYLESADETDEVFELPFEELNQCVLGGYRRREITVLAAHSGFGKTWLLDEMLDGFHGQGYKCAVFATEMPRRQRLARHVTAQTGISTERLLRKNLTPEQREQARVALRSVPFDYFEVAGLSEDEICERIIMGGYDVVGIDVVNYVPGYEEKPAYANRIIQRFNAAAQRGDCHIILVSHLNRERDKDKVKPRPVKRDLKQTSSLEQVAHAILFLHRDQDADGELEPGAEAYFAKVRNGIEGSVRIFQNRRFLTFQPEAQDRSFVMGRDA